MKILLVLVLVIDEGRAIKITDCTRRPGPVRVFVFVFIFPSPPRRAALKEQILSRLIRLGLPVFAPARTVPDDPVRERLLKADITTGLLRFNPFVPQDFLPLGLEFTVKR